MTEKRLTKEIAEQFLADDESVDLSEFTEVDDGAAENLSRHRGYLDLNGLTSLSDAASARPRSRWPTRGRAAANRHQLQRLLQRC